MKEHLLNPDTWLRGLFMLLFLMLLCLLSYSPIQVLIILVTVVQFGFVLFTGELNPYLLRFGEHLCLYTYQVLRFLTYVSDEKPFPFGRWPSE